MGSSIAFAAAVAAFATQSASSSQAKPLEPSGPWKVDYADSMCSLSRQYGDLKTGLILGFRPAPLSDNFRVAVLLLDNSKKVSRGKAQLEIGNSPMVEAPFARGPVKIEGLNIVAVDVTRESQAALGKAQKLTVAAGEFTAQFKLTNTAEAMTALDACEQDLLVTWGMDPKVVASLASYPTQRGGVASLFRADDYPQAALAKNEQGTTGVRIRVSKEGKVGDCQIIESSGSDTIDKQTCEIFMARARFQPARTKDGRAVDSIALQRIRWELPE